MSKSRAERGASLIEFALILPILALVMSAVVDISVSYKNASEANNAAQIAARYFSVNADEGFAAAKTAAGQASSNIGSPADNATHWVWGAAPTCTPGSPVVVTVSWTFEPRLLPWPNTITVNGKGVSQCAG